MSKNIKVIDHKGIEYRNEKEMREAYGISRQLYIFRKKKGYTQEECLSPAGSFLHEQHNKGPLLTFTVNGEEYAGLQSLADKYGVSVSWISFIKSRFDNDIGKTIEYFEKRSKNIKIRETRRKRLDKQPVCTKGPVKAPNGKTYKTSAAMCRDYGIKYRMYQNCLHRGMTMAESIKFCLNKNKLSA